jgi:hypothetical protein
MDRQPDQDLVDEVRAIVAARMAPFAFDRIEVRIDVDTEGDEALFIDAWYPLSPFAVEPRKLIDARSEIRTALIRRGDSRFPYLAQHFADGQTIAAAA